MAVTAEEIDILVKANIKDAMKGLTAVEKKTDSFGKSFTKMAKTLAGPLAAGAIIAAMVKIGKEASQLAAEAEEIDSKFSVVFDSTAKNMNDWADEYAGAVGRSVSDIKKYMGNIGDTLKPLGFPKEAVDDLSKSMVTLAGDLGSFNDIDTADVMRDLQSALVGNVEVLRKYGVVANEAAIKTEAMASGLWDGVGAIDAQEKAQAILNITMKGTTDAQGDLLRTQDSATNTFISLTSATKDWKIELGKTVNEGLTPMAAAATTIIKKLTEYSREAREARDLTRELGEDDEISTENITILTDKYDTLNKQLKQLKVDEIAFFGEMKKAAGERINTLTADIAKIKEKIDNVTRINFLQLEAIDIEKEYGEARKLSAVDAKIAYEKQKSALDDNIEAARTLVQLDLDRLTPIEEALSLNQDEIDQWAALRDAAVKNGQPIIDMRNLINQLVRDRTVLEGEQADILAETAEKEQAILDDEHAAMQQAWTDRIALNEAWDEADNWIEEYRQAEVTKLIDEETQALKDQEEEFKAIGSTISTFTKGPLEALGEALVLGGDAWTELGKAGIISIANVVSALGDQAVIQAAVAYASGNIGVGSAFAAAAVAAYIASGAIKASADTFAEGGDFVTQGPEAIIVGDNPGGRERVTVEPLSSSNIKGPSGEGARIIINLDGQPIADFMTAGLRNGDIQVYEGAVVQ